MKLIVPLFLAAILLSACNSDKTVENQSFTTTPALPTEASVKVEPTEVLTPTLVPVETDANLQKLFDADKDVGFDANFQQLQKDLQ